MYPQNTFATVISKKHVIQSCYLEGKEQIKAQVDNMFRTEVLPYIREEELEDVTCN